MVVNINPQPSPPQSNKYAITIVVTALLASAITFGITYWLLAQPGQPSDSTTVPLETPMTETQVPIPTPDDSFKEISKANNLVNYSGSAVVSGTFNIASEGIQANTLCFYVDQETGQLIPRNYNDGRIPWFCFKNEVEAKTLLDIDSAGTLGLPGCDHIVGEAKIKISDYTQNLMESSVHDTAKLTGVIQITSPATCARGSFDHSTLN